MGCGSLQKRGGAEKSGSPNGECRKTLQVHVGFSYSDIGLCYIQLFQILIVYSGCMAFSKGACRVTVEDETCEGKVKDFHET